MSVVRTVSRTVLTTGLTIARLPLDAMLRVAGDSPVAGAAKLGVDRVDATVRNAAGIFLADEQLRADATRRRAAADERERAMRLHAEAEDRVERADERIEETRKNAQQRRGSAAKTAQRRRSQTKERRDAAKSQAAKKASRREQQAEQEAARAQDQIEKKARRTRVDHLETKAEALQEKEAALETADEGQRLRAAASKVKAERKSRRS